MKSKYTGYLQYIYNVQQYSKFESMFFFTCSMAARQTRFLIREKVFIVVLVPLLRSSSYISSPGSPSPFQLFYFQSWILFSVLVLLFLVLVPLLRSSSSLLSPGSSSPFQFFYSQSWFLFSVLALLFLVLVPLLCSSSYTPIPGSSIFLSWSKILISY